MIDFLDRMRTVARIATLAGIAVSAAFLLRAGHSTPRFLLFLMAGWVLAPFIALTWAGMISKRWSVPARAMLHGVMIVITLAALAIYWDDSVGHRMPQAGFVFVVVPLGSWILMAAVALVTAFMIREATS